jgi:hypothetical protein
VSWIIILDFFATEMILHCEAFGDLRLLVFTERNYFSVVNGIKMLLAFVATEFMHNILL